MVEPEQEHVDLLLRHGQILTMDPERRILVDGAIAVRGGRIVAAGPDREVGDAYTGVEERDLNGALVHPGLIDAHVHAGMQELTAGFGPKDLAESSLVDNSLFAAMSPERDYLGALKASVEMAANGTTFFSDTGGSFFLDEAVRAIETVGIRGNPGNFLLDVAAEVPDPDPDEWGGSITVEESASVMTSTDECKARLADQLERYPYGRGARVGSAVAVYGCCRCSDELLLEAKRLAEQQGVPMIMHQSWGPEEVTISLHETGRRPIEHLSDLGILDENLTLVHMNHLSDDELALVIESGVGVVHCPAASARRGMGAIRHGRFPEMLDAGVRVALGSDGISGRRDVLRQAYLAGVGFREMRGDFPVLTGENVLEMATLHGASVLGLDDELGSIEAGKRADIVIHTLDRPEAHPRFKDPVDRLVYFQGSSTVDTVFVDGEAILDRGRFTRFDVTEAYRTIDAESARFEGGLGASRFAVWPLVE